MKMQGYIIENKLAPDHDQQLVNTYFYPPVPPYSIAPSKSVRIECQYPPIQYADVVSL